MGKSYHSKKKYRQRVDEIDQSKISVDGWDDISEETAREMIKSLGQPVLIKPKWIKVRLND